MVNRRGFERSLVVKTVAEGLQWQIVMDGEIACVSGLALGDPSIWGERDAQPTVYIHRIATDAKFRGNHFAKHIIAWCAGYALGNDRNYNQVGYPWRQRTVAQA
ncbi:hypothetical protein [Pedobacter sp. UYP30]|uniref:hypothetical protein n=1 Tax=Pedobacter sp. UYP30 TaxID=1756400 RepID=UPI003392FA17